ncbi:MAG: TPM domain-containing protein [Clostridia bacterium]|nr:TPM domain-containing protein [Clostridia bacterium]
MAKIWASLPPRPRRRRRPSLGTICTGWPGDHRTLFLSFLFFTLAVTVVVPPAAALAVDIPPPPQGPDIYVCDRAGVIKADHARAMSQLAAALDRATGAQLVVVTVESLGDTPIEDYALRLFRTWGIGQRGKNNGVLMLVNRENMLAARRGRVRIEVGYGLEGAIPDGRAGRILDEYVLPAWERGAYSEGVYQGFLALAGAIAQEYGVDLEKETALAPLAPYAADPPGSLWPEALFFLLLFGFLSFLVWQAQKKQRYGHGPRGPFWGWPGGGFGGGFGGFGGGGFGGGSSGGGGASR